MTTWALRVTIKAQNLDVIFLCETKATKDHMKKLACSIGFLEYVIVGAQGQASGICLLWSNDLDVSVVEFDSRIVAISVHDESCTWTLIGFYGPPYYAKWCNT